jgi:hypothetical protein
MVSAPAMIATVEGVACSSSQTHLSRHQNPNYIL